MKKLVLLGALALAGCATPGSVGEVSTRAKEIQELTRTICRFVPTIGTIASILSAGSAPVIAIANDICLAVTTAPLADGPGRIPKVRGVVIKGRFV
jgi:hypothetical protein